MEHSGGGAVAEGSVNDASAAVVRRGAASQYVPAIGLIILLVVTVTLPFTMSNFRLFQFTQVLIYAIALLGLNMLTGYNGQISLGHGAFYAIGAYTTAIMIDRWSVG